MIADMLTKGLSNEQFEKLLHLAGVTSCEEECWKQLTTNVY